MLTNSKKANIAHANLLIFRKHRNIAFRKMRGSLPSITSHDLCPHADFTEGCVVVNYPTIVFLVATGALMGITLASNHQIDLNSASILVLIMIFHA